MTQYNESYTVPNDTIKEIVANSVSILDEYVLCQTGQYEYTALIKNLVNGEIEQITIDRNYSDGNYSYTYDVTREIVDTFEYNIPKEYYAVSNIGIGTSLGETPVQSGLVSFGVTALTTLVFFMVIFKGGLFKCLQKRKR